MSEGESSKLKMKIRDSEEKRRWDNCNSMARHYSGMGIRSNYFLFKIGKLYYTYAMVFALASSSWQQQDKHGAYLISLFYKPLIKVLHEMN